MDSGTIDEVSAEELEVAAQEADEFERRVQAETTAQFKRLKEDAQTIYGLTRGRPGVRTPEEWAALLEKAGDEIGNGRFLVRSLGAERYLEPATVAVLLTLRQNLIADLPTATAVDVMMIDAAVIGYYNMLRTQQWIGDLSLVVERELFGQAPLNEIHGDKVGDEVEEQLRRLAEVMMPLQERASRMTMRSLEAHRSALNRRPLTNRRAKKPLAQTPARKPLRISRVTPERCA